MSEDKRCPKCQGVMELTSDPPPSDTIPKVRWQCLCGHWEPMTPKEYTERFGEA